MSLDLQAAFIGLVLLGGVLLAAGWVAAANRSVARVSRRLGPYATAADGRSVSVSAVGIPPLGLSTSRGGRRPRALDRLERFLRRGDLQWSPIGFLAIDFCLAGFVGLAVLLRTRLLFGAVLAAAAALLVPWFVAWRRSRARERKLEGQLAEALDMIAGASASGHTFQHGLQLVAREMESPIATEVRLVVEAIGLGKGVEAALEELTQRNSSYDLRLTVTAINVHRSVGGNLTEMLQRIAETVRERQQVRGEVSALTAQGKLSGLVVSLIPPGLLAVLSAISPSYTASLTGTGLGRMLIAACVLAWLLGFLMIRKITDVEY